MEYPLINIITRASRPNYFRKCYESIHNQTYGNFNHIVTYETDEMYKFLSEFTKNGRMTLVRVPNRKRIPGLRLSWNHNPATEGYINPDHEFLDYKLDLNSEYRDVHFPVTQKHYIKPSDGSSWSYPNVTWREHTIHAPYNIYLKIAEKKVKSGWVMYLDDDDIFMDNEVLMKLSEHILKCDEDTLHISRFILPNKYIIPNDELNELYQVGFPLTVKQIAGVCLLFHSKYIDYTYWDEWICGDYRTAVSLREIIPKVNLTNLIAVKLPTGTNAGSSEDLKS